jgi:hypothetical protein
LPTLCHAIWAVPDEGAQKAAFGSVVLSGQELARYVLWVKSLPAPCAEAWNRMVAGLKPGNCEALRTFRFEGDDAPARVKHAQVQSLYEGLTR